METMKHICSNIIADKYQSEVVYDNSNKKDGWYLFDGDPFQMDRDIKYCPYCGELLNFDKAIPYEEK